MLSEAFSFLFAKCENKFRRFGYLHEAIAIDARFQRCQSAWASHLENTRSEISSAICKLSKHKKVIVLGAGAGHDIPLNNLERQFEMVVLVDVVFLKSIRQKARRSSSIFLVEADLTGLVTSVEQLKPGFDVSEVRSNPPADLLKDADLVISCNVLSQLPINIQNWLIKSGIDEDSDKLKICCRNIVIDHLTWLEGCEAPVLLITDLDRQLSAVSEPGKEDLRDNALYGLKFNKLDKSWIWNIAPSPEIDKNYNLKHLVGSVYLNREEFFDITY
ncbi:hypothetical protein WH96_08060 [Kiloniella spongiae]|uniref:Methyltransferase domain-containing protein n=1 Tax=Kiloniella spongiae TaxID=1489064 RepID=A0A0H2MF02_9PROT|nr:hypothetical protein [Kiloniella spongiae]KLN61114.1 hypothetical protein WH96_08060 [Kiloniella spongiae]